MKILNLKIIDPQGVAVQNLRFEKTGVSYIYGDIKDPKNQSATINSLGKTLLLKFIDYIFGANEDSDAIKPAIHDYKLEAVVLLDNHEYLVTRTLGNSDSISVDGKPKTLQNYKKFFSIERNLYNRQIILKKKASEISYRTPANEQDVVSYLKLLGLYDIINKVDFIYKSQDKIKSLKKSKQELVSYYDGIEIEQIDEEIFFIDKEVKKLTSDISEIVQKIKEIKISQIQKNIVEEYANKSKELKELKRRYEQERLEHERLKRFINDSNKVDIPADHILSIYKKAQQEIPDMIKKSISEVEEFHKKVYSERKEFLNQRQDKILVEMSRLREKINFLSSDLDKIGAIISMNEVYQESIDLYEKYSSDLQELKFRQGKLSQIKDIDSSIDSENKKLDQNFGNATKIRKEYESIVNSYRDFIFDITQNIYDNDVHSFFDIKIRKKHLRSRPVVFEFSLKGDTGEGVSEVKKNLMDYLVCRYNDSIEVMIQDSSCYNGIDPRQVAGMFLQLSKIAEKSDKQIIIAVNKYQLGSHNEAIDMVEKNSVITLSENTNLLGIEF